MKLDFNIGDKVVIKTKRDIKTASSKLMQNDVVEIKAFMARGGYQVYDLLGQYMGIVRKSDIRKY
ncbi:hypothetical protein CMU19_07250 [Elizabethkingia anophelis]|nr:hypothetical protein [Elizabethkingia anophelis]